MSSVKVGLALLAGFVFFLKAVLVFFLSGGAGVQNVFLARSTA
jgi:hypothetical protein